MSKRLTTEEFIEKAKLIHKEDYDYSLVDYKNTNTKVKIICNKCDNIFLQSPAKHLKGKGCPNCNIFPKRLTKELFIEKANKIHNFKYDYSLTNYINIRTKVKIICNTCGNIFLQKPNSHLNGNGCPFCFGTPKLTTEQFIEKANKIHNFKYDYSLVDYKNNFTKIKIVCKKCGNIFLQMPRIHLEGKGCPNCNFSKGEKIIENYLEKNKIDFIPQKTFSDLKDKKLLSYDFYIPSLNLLIEYNGLQHYKNTFKKSLHNFHRQLHHDWLKRKYAKKNRFNLLTIKYNDDIIKKLMEVIN